MRRARSRILTIAERSRWCVFLVRIWVGTSLLQSLLGPLSIGPAVPGPPVLGGPGSDPLPIDPHAAVGRLIEAFHEVLDLSLDLSFPHGLGRLVGVHHHGPLEVGYGAGQGFISSV